MAPAPGIRMGSTLSLSPRFYEEQFWRSGTYHRAANFLDVWTLYFTMIMNAVFLKWQVQLHGLHASFRVLPAVFFLAMGISQFAWSKLLPKSYFRYRSKVVVFNRITRLAIVAAHLVILRTSPGAEDGVVHAITSPSCLVDMPPFLALLKYLMHLSASGMALTHGINDPLPFAQQALLHALYFALLVTFQLHPALRMLQRVSPPLPLQQLCLGLNSALDHAAGLFLGAPPPGVQHLDALCDSHAPIMLLLFVDLYLALLLPVFLSYRLEQHQKVAFLLELRRGGARGAGAQHDRPELQHDRLELQHDRPELQHNRPELQHDRPDLQHDRPGSGLALVYSVVSLRALADLGLVVVLGFQAWILAVTWHHHLGRLAYPS